VSLSEALAAEAELETYFAQVAQALSARAARHLAWS
jgi:hypothetical protein